MSKYKDNMFMTKAYPIFKSYAVYFTGAYMILVGSVLLSWLSIFGALMILGQAMYDLVFVIRNVRQNFLLLWLDVKAKRWVLYRIKESVVEDSNSRDFHSKQSQVHSNKDDCGCTDEERKVSDRFDRVYDVAFVRSSLRHKDVARSIKSVKLLDAQDVEVQKFPFPFRIPFPAAFVSREVLHINNEDSNMIMSSIGNVRDDIDITSKPMGSQELIDIGVSGY